MEWRKSPVHHQRRATHETTQRRHEKGDTISHLVHFGHSAHGGSVDLLLHRIGGGRCVEQGRTDVARRRQSISEVPHRDNGFVCIIGDHSPWTDCIDSNSSLGICYSISFGHPKHTMLRRCVGYRGNLWGSSQYTKHGRYIDDYPSMISRRSAYPSLVLTGPGRGWKSVQDCNNIPLHKRVLF